MYIMICQYAAVLQLRYEHIDVHNVFIPLSRGDCLEEDSLPNALIALFQGRAVLLRMLGRARTDTSQFVIV